MSATSQPLSARSIGVSLFAAQPAPDGSPWAAERAGRPLVQTMALGLSFATLDSLLRRSDRQVEVLVDRTTGPDLLRVDSQTPDPRRIADLGRENGNQIALMARVELEPLGLQAWLVDCERRRVAAETRFGSDDPWGWVHALSSWVLGSLEQAPPVSEDGPAPTAEAAVEALVAIAQLHEFELRGRREALPEAFRGAVAALEAGPGFRPFLDLTARVVSTVRTPIDDVMHARLLSRLPELAASDRWRLVAALAPWGMHEKLLEALEEETEEGDAQRRRLRLALLVESGRGDEAKVEARRAVAAYPEDPLLLQHAARLLENLSREEWVEEAQLMWSKLLELNRDDPEALVARVAGLAERDPDEAERLAVQAFELGLVSERLFEAAARLVDPPREPGEAFRRAVSSVVTLDDATPIQHGLFSCLLDRCGEGARAELHRTVGLDQGMTHPFAARVWALQRRPSDHVYAARIDALALKAFGGEPAETQVELEQALAEEPDDPQLRFLLGVVAAQAEEHERAAELFGAVAEAQPGMAEVRLHQGIALSMADKTPEAIRIFEGLVKRWPRNADVRHLFAVTLLKGGEGERGLREVQQTLAIDATHKGARELLEEVRGWEGEAEDGARGEGEVEDGAQE